jgi:hypothetical protein
MTPDQHDRRHRYAAEMLEDYALSTLYADEAAWIEEHLTTCPSCQRALDPLIAAAQSLVFAAPDPPVPVSDDLWDRIARSLPPADASPPAADAPAEPLPSNIRPFRPRQLMTRQWMAVAALVVLSLLGGAVLGQLLTRTDEDPIDSQTIAVQFTDPNMTATGVLRYIPGEEVFVLEVDGLTPPPAGFVHQGWLIDASGPVPAGLMDPHKGELAAVGTLDQYQTFAITLEPGPLGNAAPTTDPILVAPLEDVTDAS